VKEAVPPAVPQKREISEKPAVKPSAPEPAAQQRERPAEKEKKRVTEKAEEKRRHTPAVTRRDTPSGQPAVEKALLPKPQRKSEAAEKRVETKKPAVKQPPKVKPAKTVGPAAESRLPVTERPARPVLEVKEVQDLDALVRQYEKYPRYVTALKIARLYYEKKDYENAALWARKANLIDRDDEEAWVLYAKSEYALGNRERAKRILRLYLDYRDSVKARTLLLSWGKENGTEEEKGR
jgi:tetratricopeptide (TPR) repeat protein